MTLFVLNLPSDKPSGLDALKAAGFRVRRQDGVAVLEADDEATLVEVQAFLDRYNPLGQLKAAAVEAIKEEATRRIHLFAGPLWRRENALMRAVRINYRLTRRLLAAIDPTEPPEDPLTDLEKIEIENFLIFERKVVALRRASDRVEADALALESEDALRAFDPAASPRWPGS